MIKRILSFLLTLSLVSTVFILPSAAISKESLSGEGVVTDEALKADTLALAPKSVVLDESCLSYNVSGDQVTVTGKKTGISGDVVIPSTLGGYPVTGIGSSAFYGCTTITSLVLPSGLSYIGWGAFCGCTNLITVTIPAGITTIASSIFQSCTSLKEIIISEGTALIGEGQFQACTALDKITIPSSVKTIRDVAFKGCKNLKAVTILSSDIAESIIDAKSCGWLCYYAKTVVLPQDIVNIGSYLQEQLSVVSSYKISGTVYRVYADHAHEFTTTDSGKTQICSVCGLATDGPCVAGHDMKSATCQTPCICTRCGLVEGEALGHLFDAPTCLAPSVCERCDEIVADALGHDLVEATCTTSIMCRRCSYKRGSPLGHDMQDATCTAPSTCSRCDFFEGVALGHVMEDANCISPSSCTRCGTTEGVALGHSWGEWVERITPTYVFDGSEIRVCEHDSSHTETRVKVIPSLICEWECGTTLRARLCADESTPGKYTLHIFGTGEMYSYSTSKRPWEGYTSDITAVYVYEGVTSIGSNAFLGCTDLKNATISPDLQHIEYAAFQGCTALKSLELPEGVLTIGWGAFNGCTGLTAVCLPSTIKEMQSSLFQGCTSLVEVTLSEGITSIADGQFQNCSALKSIVIPASVESIGASAFKNCFELSSVAYAEGSRLMSIGVSAFSKCSELKIITIPQNVSAIGDYAYWGCNAVTTITVADGNTTYCAIGNNLIHTASKTLLLGCQNSSIPDDGSVISIEAYAFSFCQGLSFILVPECVREIGEAAFEQCTNLKVVIIESDSIAKALIASTSCGGLCSFAETVIFSALITEVGSFVSEKYEFSHPLTVNAVASRVYSTHSHAEFSSVWSDDVCTACAIIRGYELCGEGHDLAPAECLAPPICQRCGYIVGDALGHDMQPAECLSPSQCARCDYTEGVALGHVWGSWEEDVVPTYVSNGSELRVCLRDHEHVETRVKPSPTPTSEWLCGDDVIARLYPDLAQEGKYTLHVFGNGEMYDYTANAVPWVEYLAKIVAVTVYEGVVSIGDFSFRDCISLTTAIIPKSVTIIGEQAFRGCGALVVISPLYSVMEIKSRAFYECGSLTQITFGEMATLATVNAYAFTGCLNLELVTIVNDAAIAGLTDYDAYASLIAYADTVILPANVSVPVYITDYYAFYDTVMIDGVACIAYSFHSHATDASTWDNGVHGMTCAQCGLLRDFSDTEEPRYALGDINADGLIDIADIVAVINIASGGVLCPEAYPGEVDVTNDDVIDIADIVTIINIASGVNI